MTTKYTIEVEVDEQWLHKWVRINDNPPETTQERLLLWAEIATAGTGISVYTVYKTEE